MKFKLLATLAAVAISQTTFAAPAACPDVNAIKKVGVEFAGQSQYGWMGVSRANNFETQDKWAFIILGITDAASDQEAVNRYNNALGTLAFQQGPIQSDDPSDETWACLYSGNENGKELMAATMTPVPEGFPELKSFQKLSFIK